jgi:uncharacterized membrane protein
MKKFIIFWIIIIALFALVRIPEFYTIIPEDNLISEKILWYDEAFTLFAAKQSLPEFIEFLGYECTPMLFYWLMFGWVRVAGASVFLNSLLPFIFNLLSLPAIYFLGKQMFNQKTGLLASLFFSLSFLNIDYATEIRAYSLLVLLSIVSLYFFWRLKEKSSWPSLIGFVIFSTLALYTHYTALALVAIEIILLFIINRYYWCKNVLAICLMFLLYLPQIIIFQRWDNLLGDGSFFARTFSHGSLEMYLNYFHSLLFGRFLSMTVFSLISGSLIIIFLLFIWRRYKDNQAVKILVGLIFAGLIILAGLKFIYQIKYFIIFTIPFILLLAFVFAQIKKSKLQTGAIMVFVLIMLSLIGLDNKYIAHSEDYAYYAPTLFQIIENQAQPGDIIVNDHFNQMLGEFYYQADSPSQLYLPKGNELITDWPTRWQYWDHELVDQQNVGLIDDLVKDHQRFWIFAYYPDRTSVQDPAGHLLNYLDNQYNKINQWQFPAGRTAGQVVQLRLYRVK